jgi:hypothetical protein
VQMKKESERVGCVQTNRHNESGDRRTSANNKSRISAPALPGVPSGTDTLEETGVAWIRLFVSTKRRTTRISATGDAPPPFTECSRASERARLVVYHVVSGAATPRPTPRVVYAPRPQAARRSLAREMLPGRHSRTAPSGLSQGRGRDLSVDSTMLIAHARAERMHARYLALHRVAYHGYGAITRPELHTSVRYEAVSPRSAYI